MNRIFHRNMTTTNASNKTTNPCLRPTQRLRDDAEAMLRDIAYVLHLTRRVKSQILHDREFVETASA